MDNDTVIFHHDLKGHIIAESALDGIFTAEYIYLNDQPLAKVEQGNVYYYHNDHLGTPQKMTDSSALTAWEGEFLPFGEEHAVGGVLSNNFRFPGQYYDQETGMHYNWHRYYDPKTGRYLRTDPLGLSGGIALYSYVLNNPINLIGPYGLKSACSNGFCVVGTEIRDWYGEVASILGLDHVDITYDGMVVYVSAGGGVDRKYARYKDTNNHWKLTKKETGSFQWGDKKGQPCKEKKCDNEEEGPKDEDILGCLRSKPRSSGKNCQGDVKAAVEGCCLTGFSTFISDNYPDLL